ncbi:hypothetical protein JB92DRAFT_3122481 [Gautieria morchelliformis]|nr:hypothetical protein JB92DRAFT_3122481 [Gautieria morchelliformis]
MYINDPSSNISDKHVNEPIVAAGADVGASSNSARLGATALTTTTLSSALTAADVELDIKERALHLVVEETFEEIGRRWMPWAANGCAIRVGELILIVDLDTLYRRIASGMRLGSTYHAHDKFTV